MGDFVITPLDASLVGLVIFVTQRAKRYIQKRWVPLIPVLLSLVFVAPAIIVAERGWPGVLIFASRVFLETAKVAALSMSTYKIGRTTVGGR